MSKKTWVPLLIAAGLAISAMPFTASAQSKQGYWTQGAEGPVWKNATGLCFIDIPVESALGEQWKEELRYTNIDLNQHMPVR